MDAPSLDPIPGLTPKDKRAADRAVINATVTGARHDDETAGLIGLPGVLHNPQHCHICRASYTTVDAFYHRLCPICARENTAKRAARTDLSGRRALVTGGRAKIGMYITLRLLRDGAHVTLTTRFPADAARRFAAAPDAAEWMSRLVIVGIDLRDPRQVIRLAEMVHDQGPLDILINNAAQTVRRSRRAYSAIMAAEDVPLEGAVPEIRVLGRYGGVHARTQQLMLMRGDVGTESRKAAGVVESALDPECQVEAAHSLPTCTSQPKPQLTSEPTPSIEPEQTSKDVTLAPCLPTIVLGGNNFIGEALAAIPGPPTVSRIDAAGLIPHTTSTNTWNSPIGNIPPAEILEVTLCNAAAPMLLLNALRPALAASTQRRKYVVNVTAAEGQFSRFKKPGHPHTNMAKAALNMVVRTAAPELFKQDRILLTAVDTGWITDERPYPDRVRAWERGWRAPLDLEDGAARVYDPIVCGEQGEDVYGVLLKDYHTAQW